MQLKEKKHYDEKHSIQHKELASNDIVLLYNTRREKDMSCKLIFKWLSPYQICNLRKDKGIYILEKLNGS